MWNDPRNQKHTWMGGPCPGICSKMGNVLLHHDGHAQEAKWLQPGFGSHIP